MRCIITGASSGIGRAIALAFAKQGASVGIHYGHSQAAAESVKKLCDEQTANTALLTADLTNLSSVNRLTDEAWQLWGGVDVWINNAGVDLLTGPQSRLDYSEKLQLLLDVDVRATMLLSKQIGRRMSENGSGLILNIGWDQADRGMEGDSGELFAAAKNAVMGFSRSLALSLAPRVRVNCIAPGWIRTAWGEQASDAWQQRVFRETPLQRWGTPEDIASVATFLASPAADYITGQVINVNGGAVR